jgi:hypothetical protein
MDGRTYRASTTLTSQTWVTAMTFVAAKRPSCTDVRLVEASKTNRRFSRKAVINPTFAERATAHDEAEQYPRRYVQGGCETAKGHEEQETQMFSVLLHGKTQQAIFGPSRKTTTNFQYLPAIVSIPLGRLPLPAAYWKPARGFAGEL